MLRALKALIVEDSEVDAELLCLELGRLGFQVVHERVETETDMERALDETEWDIVFSDYSMPGFNALRALDVLKRSGADIPFVIVSGTIGEEVAVEAMRWGAQDFLIKGRLTRLLPIIERELMEVEARHERRRAEEALRASEVQYRRIVETSQEGIWLIDEDDRTSYVNQRLAELFGFAAAAMAGCPFLDFVDPGWAGAAWGLLERRRQGIRDRTEVVFRRADGTRFWASVSASPILDERGVYGGFLAMVTDLSEERRLQAQLMSADRMASIGLLAAGVAHELKNALASALANLELAGRDRDELEKTQGGSAQLTRLTEEIDDAREGVERVHELARDLNVLSLPSEDETTRVDLNRALEAAVRICRIQIRQRARLSEKLSEVPAVIANESRLVQVFLNLLVNAAQAIPGGSSNEHEIRISTWVDAVPGEVVAEVRDTGVGMSQETLEKLFTPFFTTKPSGEGTGLGLSICQRIVQSFGGSISVESAAGRGSSFQVRLPRAPAEESAAAVHTVLPKASGRRGSILVLDDDAAIRAVMERILSELHAVTLCDNASEALEIIAAGRQFDLIFCDADMPGMSGAQLHEQLLAIAPGLAERIVFMSGGVHDHRLRSYLERIGNEHLDKPFRVGELQSLVVRRLG